MFFGVVGSWVSIHQPRLLGNTVLDAERANLTYASVATYVRRGHFLRATRIHWLLLWFVGTNCCGFNVQHVFQVHCASSIELCLFAALLGIGTPCLRSTPLLWHARELRLAHGSEISSRLATTDLNVNGCVLI